MTAIRRTGKASSWEDCTRSVLVHNMFYQIICASTPGRFLCEIKSIGGFSGSPVLLAPISEAGRPDGSSLIDEARLLGVDWAHLANFESAVDQGGIELPHIRFATNSGMMAVAPAWKLIHLLDHPKEMELREMAEDAELNRRKGPKVVRDSRRAPLSDDVEPNHRGRFTALLNEAARKPEPKD
jgi:hypothetical protein